MRLLFEDDRLAMRAHELAGHHGAVPVHVRDIRRLCRDGLQDEPEVVFWLDEDGLAVRLLEPAVPGPVRVDFASGAAEWRRLHGGGRGEMVAKACGLKKDFIPSVFDATAGLGRDAFVLASLGCTVTLCERSPVVSALLEDGLRRAGLDDEVGPIAARMSLLSGSAIQRLGAGEVQVDVVYLDPMFPHRDKAASVKKEMKVFQMLVGADEDADALLAPALLVACKRVVVKRPRLAPWLAGKKPSMAIEGKSSRFDVYMTV